MDRLNSEGIPRERLPYALRNVKMVGFARRIDSCMLCKRHKVNEAGLCDLCLAILTDEELKLASRWMMGVGP